MDQRQFESPVLRRPPFFTLAAGLLMLAIGAATGGTLVLLQDAFYAVARQEVVKRPEIHGFAGAEIIDEARIAEVAEQTNNALRLLHVHALGVGMMILLATLAIVNMPIAERAQWWLCVLISLGALYPPGWFVLAWLIPYWGVDRLRAPVEWVFFVPFGGAIIAGLWGAVVLYLVAMLKRPPVEQR
jgi:hypothetical protein